MPSEQFYALYIEGREKPVGALSASAPDAVDELRAIIESYYETESYRAEPITLEKAREITDLITQLSPSSEELFKR